MIKKTWSALTRLNPWQAALFIFLLSFTVRLLFIFAFHLYRDLGRYELERTAISLATTGVYGNPYAIPTGPTAHVSPGYTLILAALFKLFGTGTPAEIVKEVLACLVTSLQYAIIPFVAEALTVNSAAALAAGLICALLPVKPLVQMDGDWETPYTALFVLVLTALTSVAWQSRDTSVITALRNGLVWGIALLFASVLAPVLVVSTIVGTYFYRAVWRRYLTFSTVQLLVAFLCLAPWAIRNYYSLGKFIFTRSNLGIELRVSNNDQASPDQRENYLHGVYARYHPLLNKEEAERVRDLGEVEYNRRAEVSARYWITQHPTQYLKLTLGRCLDFWFYPDPTSKLKAIFLDLAGFLGILGALYLLYSKPAPGLAVALVLLLYPAPNYFIHVGLRQRYPIDALLTLLSCVWVFSLWNTWATKHSQAAGAGPQRETQLVRLIRPSDKRKAEASHSRPYIRRSNL